MRGAPLLAPLAAALLATTFFSGSAAAEVVQVDDRGFTIVQHVDVAVPRDRAFAALLRPADWWNPDHSWSGDAANLTIEPRVGGCWCETLSGGGVEHGRVVALDRARGTIVFDSLLGPLLETGLAGRLIWRVTDSDRSAGPSRISWTYRVVMPPAPDGSAPTTLAAAVDRVLGAQLARLADRLAARP